jgi:hypothetical protein
MDAQGILYRFIHIRIFRGGKDVIWSWRGFCFTAGMNVRRHNGSRCGRQAVSGVTRAGFVFAHGPFASRKSESICASPTRY